MKLLRDFTEKEQILIIKENPHMIEYILNAGISPSEAVQLTSIEVNQNTIHYLIECDIKISQNVLNAHYIKWNL